MREQQENLAPRRKSGRKIYPSEAFATERTRLWRIANPERHKSMTRAYQLSNRERIAERKRRYYLANKDKISAKEKVRRALMADELAKTQAAWRAANPEKRRAICSRYRARKRGAEGAYSGEDISRIWESQKGKCDYCGGKLGKDFQIDHKVPLSRGGSNWPSNLCLACKPCNSGKCDKTDVEYREYLSRVEVVL